MAHNEGRGRCEAVKRVINHAVAAGWRVGQTSKQHLRFTKAGRPAVFFSGSPSDHRAALNVISQLRRTDLLAEQQPCLA
ncbi:hypothetical protein D3C81_2074430 [compost metagenome]